MNQDNVQLNIDELGNDSAGKRKLNKVFDILLWVIIVVLAIVVFVRAFVISRVTIDGASMTADYYNSESSSYYEPSLTYHSGDKVTVNKLAKPKRGDVVVFYKHPVKSKFLALFARGDSSERDGDYYKLIKRVVALGGDKLWVEHVNDNQYKLIVETNDGTVLREDYYKKNGKTLNADCFLLYDQDISGLGRLKECTQDNPLVIEDGYFFAIGDNRTDSDDSRGDLGQVPISQIFGIVI